MTIATPCDHGSWEHVRIRRKISTLRCRVCQRQFKLSYEALKKARCHKFAAGDCARTECQFLHVHVSKQSLVERVEIHGEALLDNVPEPDRPKEKEAVAVCPPSPSAASSTTTESSEAVDPMRQFVMPPGASFVNEMQGAPALFYPFIAPSLQGTQSVWVPWFCGVPLDSHL